VPEEGWEGVSDAGEPGASEEDAEEDDWVGSPDFRRRVEATLATIDRREDGVPGYGGSVRCGPRDPGPPATILGLAPPPVLYPKRRPKRPPDMVASVSLTGTR
jgi:hypothetical protein